MKNPSIFLLSGLDKQSRAALAAMPAGRVYSCSPLLLLHHVKLLQLSPVLRLQSAQHLLYDGNERAKLAW